jgi:hypothetical protein
MFSQSYDSLEICPVSISSLPALSFLHNFEGALAFLLACPPVAGMQRDMVVALTHDVANASKYTRKDRLHAVARRLADGRLTITDRYANKGTLHNFKRLPKVALTSVPAPAALTSLFKAPPSVTIEVPEIDESAQLQTLKNAAENGIPFCEVCEKAKAEQARSQA